MVRWQAGDACGILLLVRRNALSYCLADAKSPITDRPILILFRLHIMTPNLFGTRTPGRGLRPELSQFAHPLLVR